DALDQRVTDGPRHEPSIDLDTRSPVSECIRSSLRISRDCSLARANLRLGSVGFRLGAARNFSLGSPALSRGRIFRKNYIRHVAFWRNAEGPFDGIRSEGVCLSDALGRPPTAHAWCIPEFPRSLARPLSCRVVHRGSNSDAPLPRATLIQLHARGRRAM